MIAKLIFLKNMVPFLNIFQMIKKHPGHATAFLKGTLSFGYKRGMLKMIIKDGTLYKSYIKKTHL